MFIKCSDNTIYYFLARAYSKNVEGQDLLLKEYFNDFSSGQQCAAESPPALPSENHDLCAHDSPSSESQESRVSVVFVRNFLLIAL
jgi:hypothetical protein